jgi:hypothetical protein
MVLGPYQCKAMVEAKIAEIDAGLAAPGEHPGCFTRPQLVALRDSLAYLAKFAPKDLDELPPPATPTYPMPLTTTTGA